MILILHIILFFYFSQSQVPIIPNPHNACMYLEIPALDPASTL